MNQLRKLIPVGGGGLLGLASLGLLGYGVKESFYTGKICVSKLQLFLVDGGHRAIIFSRIGGVRPDIYPEGLHFR